MTRILITAAASLILTAAIGYFLLFKGSRGMRMELALEQFLREDK